MHVQWEIEVQFRHVTPNQNMKKNKDGGNAIKVTKTQLKNAVKASEYTDPENRVYL